MEASEVLRLVHTARISPRAEVTNGRGIDLETVERGLRSATHCIDKGAGTFELIGPLLTATVRILPGDMLDVLDAQEV